MLKKNYQAIWLTGQPASGKSTLAKLLVSSISDGDNNVFNIRCFLGYSFRNKKNKYY